MNASSWSARYAARKMAAWRAELAKPKQPEPCLHCGALIPVPMMKIFCEPCDAERMRLFLSGPDGPVAAQEWIDSGPYARKMRGEP